MAITSIKVQLVIQTTEGNRSIELTTIDSDDVAAILVVADRYPEIGQSKIKRLVDFFEATIEEKLFSCVMLQAQQSLRERRALRRAAEEKTIL